MIFLPCVCQSDGVLRCGGDETHGNTATRKSNTGNTRGLEGIITATTRPHAPPKEEKEGHERPLIYLRARKQENIREGKENSVLE